MANDLKHEIVRKEAAAKLCPMAEELSKVLDWGGRVLQIRKDVSIGNINIKFTVGVEPDPKFEAEISVLGTPDNVDTLSKANRGGGIFFFAIVSKGENFCLNFTPSRDGSRIGRDQLFFENIGRKDNDYHTARSIGYFMSKPKTRPGSEGGLSWREFSVVETTICQPACDNS